ncbi:MAG: FtsX-like permease family protein [Planctomycetes bacterium]|nr:FtsX-like permease family protein [Planctomycetota bacterium]
MVMRAIHHKLLRDLWHMRGQALAIVLIIGAGVTLFVGQLSTLQSLTLVRDTYYSEYRFAEVFAACKRAPAGVADRLRAIPGADTVDTRVTLQVMLEVPGLDEPATGQLISIPDGHAPALNNLFLRTGRLPNAESTGEVVLVEMFATANDYHLGDNLTAIINGRRQQLRVVGIALSPEYVYALSAGAMVPDDKRFGVMWMNERELAAAYNMEGAFNSVSMTLGPGASEPEVIARVDDILKPYGGLGAYARKDQVSNWFLANEFRQLQTFGVLIPMIFLGIAGFLLNVVLARLISTQRDQIAALKAFGYSNLQVAIHYGQFIGLVVLVGAIIGTLCGWWMGEAMIGLYTDYYHFPILKFFMPGWVPLAAAAFTAVAGAIGTMNAVRRAAALPPAEAMRPEAPPTYRMTLMERLGLQRWLSQPTRMILRQLERRPLKAGASVLGLSMAVAILVMGLAFLDIMFYVIDLQSNVMHREDVKVGFIEPRSRDALHEVEGLPGVIYAEPYRTVPAKVRYGHRDRRVGIQGVPSDTLLNRVLDTKLQPFPLPADGILLSRVLGEALQIRPGDKLIVEVLEGPRPTRTVKVAALVDDFMGVAAYMEIGALNHLMREGDVISGANVLTDKRHDDELFAALRARPIVAGVSSKASTIANLRKMIEDNLMISVGFNVLFAAIIAFGIIYNNARISLSERARELASLRVLGLTRAEISFILLGEQAILTMLAVPFGFLLGRWMTGAMLLELNSEVMRFPLVVNEATYAIAAVAVIVSATISGLLVRERLDKLDLVEVLKTRE